MIGIFWATIISLVTGTVVGLVLSSTNNFFIKRKRKKELQKFHDALQANSERQLEIMEAFRASLGVIGMESSTLSAEERQFLDENVASLERVLEKMTIDLRETKARHFQ